ncbi:hypothetical protein ILP97_23820 [Amycolatopsis sp. H6(2020)]|nr:hypothetical protein [Amycolatopsis sp. H6(2020)]
MTDHTTSLTIARSVQYQTLTLERRDNGILLITIAEPNGYPAPTLTRRHTEISYIWRDFADDPELRVAVITGRAGLAAAGHIALDLHGQTVARRRPSRTFIS